MMYFMLMVPSKQLIDAINKFKPSQVRELNLDDFTYPKVIKVWMEYAQKHTVDEFDRLVQQDNGKIAERFFRAAHLI